MSAVADILETKEQFMIAQLQYRLDAMVEAQKATATCLSELIGAVRALADEVARPKHHEVVYDAAGNVTGSNVS